MRPYGTSQVANAMLRGAIQHVSAVREYFRGIWRVGLWVYCLFVRFDSLYIWTIRCGWTRVTGEDGWVFATCRKHEYKKNFRGILFAVEMLKSWKTWVNATSSWSKGWVEPETVMDRMVTSGRGILTESVCFHPYYIKRNTLSFSHLGQSPYDRLRTLPQDTHYLVGAPRTKSFNLQDNFFQWRNLLRRLSC